MEVRRRQLCVNAWQANCGGDLSPAEREALVADYLVRSLTGMGSAQGHEATLHALLDTLLHDRPYLALAPDPENGRGEGWVSPGENW
jgi:hypothetical protein